MKREKRKIDILVLSDVHLGTYGCHGKELLHYLKSIQPRIVVLNGDIIDIWQFSKHYWPKSHMKVIKHLIGWMSKGIETYYITGNHDEMLRKFTGMSMGSLKIVNKLVLEMPDNKKAWIFHGDVFDITMQHSKWLARLGAVGYDMLILINRSCNFVSEKVFKRGKISLSKNIKNGVKSAVKFINDFEQVSADIGIYNKYDYVICGHIHQPEMKTITNDNGSIMYLNSGDWIENLSSLEYADGEWNIYRFNEADHQDLRQTVTDTEDPEIETAFSDLLSEFNLMKQ